MEEKGKAAYFRLIPLAAQQKEGKVCADTSENNVPEEQSQAELWLISICQTQGVLKRRDEKLSPRLQRQDHTWTLPLSLKVLSTYLIIKTSLYAN